jgi:hypothetical protein
MGGVLARPLSRARPGGGTIKSKVTTNKIRAAEKPGRIVIAPFQIASMIEERFPAF